MPNEDLYELDIGFEVKIAKWRIDDQDDIDNRALSFLPFGEVQ